MGTLFAIRFPLAVRPTRKEFLVCSKNGRVLSDAAPMHLPLTVADADRYFELIGRFELVSVCFRHFRQLILDLLWQDHFVDVQNTVHADVAKEEPRKVLITFLGIDDAVVTGMAPVNKSSW